MNDLRRLWRGELPLVQAFWGWLVLGGILVNGATTALNLILVTRDLALTGLIVGYAISVPYNLLALLGVWRAAEGYSGAWTSPAIARTAAFAIAIVLCVT
jgi:hypothetical protein